MTVGQRIAIGLGTAFLAVYLAVLAPWERHVRASEDGQPIRTGRLGIVRCGLVDPPLPSWWKTNPRTKAEDLKAWVAQLDPIGVEKGPEPSDPAGTFGVDLATEHEFRYTLALTHIGLEVGGIVLVTAGAVLTFQRRPNKGGKP